MSKQLTELHELLLKHMDGAARKGYVQKPDIDKAEAAINEYIVGIIGKDEPIYNPSRWSAGVHQVELNNIERRNLRAEQRKAAGISTTEGSAS